MSEKDYIPEREKKASESEGYFTESFAYSPLHTGYKLISERRISDQAVSAFDLRPGDTGLIYPAGGGLRCKAYGDQRPKYWWIPGKPDGADFYHADGLLSGIQLAGGVVWMASGEADVWALYSSGVTWVFSTLSGEGSLPVNLAPWLQSMGVVVVYIAPDRDDTGLRWAKKVSLALASSGIRLDIRELPGCLGSKQDIGAVWQEYTLPISFERWLLGLPKLDLNSQSLDNQTRNHAVKNNQKISSSAEDIPLEYRQLVTHALGVDFSFDADGFTHKTISCPFHDDQHPSASLNALKGLYCPVCGDWYTWNSIAGQLGVISLRDWYSGERRSNQVHNYSLTTETREALITAKLTNTARLLDGLYLSGMRPGETFTIREAANITGLSPRTIRRALDNLCQNLPSYLLTALTRVNSVTNSKGRKPQAYTLPSPEDVIQGLDIKVGWQHTDDLPDNSISTARGYRMAVLEALPLRRPGNYARKTLGDRLGVSISTVRNYTHDQASRLIVKPQYSKQELRHVAIETLKEHRHEVPGNVWLEDERGGRYPATREGALRAFSRGGKVFVVEQLANFYSGGEDD